MSNPKKVGTDDTNTDDYDTDDNDYFKNPDKILRNGLTPLMYEIDQESSNKNIKRMIKNSANLEIPDVLFKRTALIYAIEKGNYKIVELLLEKGANPNTKFSSEHLLSPSFKKNPVLILDKNALDEAIEMEDNKIIELLLEYGVDLTQPDNNYDSFRYAIEQQDKQLIKLLLEKGGDINKPDEKGNLIINVALDTYRWDDERFSIFKLLIENGMNINVDSSRHAYDKKQTPLMLVINNFDNFNMDVVDYILDLKELDINYSIDDQEYAYPKTVLDAVQYIIKIYERKFIYDSDYEEIKNKLLEKGAKTGEDLFFNEKKLIKNNYDLIKSIEYPDGYEGYINLSIITIPKGTILFRKSKDINSDYCGVPQKYNKNDYLTHRDHNVFFYFYPFYSDGIDATTDEMKNKMFYLTKDIQLLNLTYPSKANRGDRHNVDYEYIFKSCNKIDEALYRYDPCLSDYFIENYPDVMGMLAIAKTDTKEHLELYYNKNNSEKDEALFYSVLWQDSEIKGSPEIILHPFQKRIKESLHEMGVVQSLEDCKKLPKNYEFLEESNKENSIVSILNEYLRPKGKNNKHITIFSPLKLFVLYEELDDKYKKSCVPLVMSIKSKLQTFQITDKDDMVPFHRVDINPDTNRTFNETIFKNTSKRGGKKGKKTHKNNKRLKKNETKTRSKKKRSRKNKKKKM
jgi:hypothetical protein